jgi:hypothetical protein
MKLNHEIFHKFFRAGETSVAALSLTQVFMARRSNLIILQSVSKCREKTAARYC